MKALRQIHQQIAPIFFDISKALNIKIPFGDFTNKYSSRSELRHFTLSNQTTLSDKFGDQ